MEDELGPEFGRDDLREGRLQFLHIALFLQKCFDHLGDRGILAQDDLIAQLFQRPLDWLFEVVLVGDEKTVIGFDLFEFL